jgi:CubicO group peptidase (beta-lactamase class C family)
MSKPVFAYRVMKLCEQGVLDLDTALTKYTPDIFLKGNPKLELITARRVLSHTTGFPNWRAKEDPLSIKFTPGTQWSYSGEGYSYLQSVITRLVGHTDSKRCGTYELGYRVCASDFGEYMIANLLNPFGMTSSGYVWNETIDKKLASAHDKNGQPIQRRRSTEADVARYGSAGSLLTTATDYGKFVIEVMDPKPPDAYRLNDASCKEMLRPQVTVPHSPIPASWALGWQSGISIKEKSSRTAADDTGFHSEAAFSISQEIRLCHLDEWR